MDVIAVTSLLPPLYELFGGPGVIDSILEEDRTVHRKQRHTAKRVFDRLCDEHGFTGSYTIVKDYIRERRHGQREIFVPLAHPPGHAQADFGEADAIIAGVKQRAHFFALELPHSDACCVVAYPAAATEAFRQMAIANHQRLAVFCLQLLIPAHKFRKLGLHRVADQLLSS